MQTSWKTLGLVVVLSVVVGALLMRQWPKPPPPPPPIAVDTALVRLRGLADSAAAAAQIHQARADSLARARHRLLSKITRLEDSLHVVATVRDSNVVLVDLVAEQQLLIADQREEMYSLRAAGQAQLHESATLRHTLTVVQDYSTKALARQQFTIDSLVRVHTTGSQCRILGVANCPSRGTMFLGGIATAGLLAITINAVK